MKNSEIKRYDFKSSNRVKLIAFVKAAFHELMSKLFSQMLKANEICVVFGKYFLPIHNKIHLHCFFRVSLVLCRIVTLLRFNRSVSFDWFKGLHLFAQVKRLFVRRGDVAEHRRLIIRCAKGGFVKYEIFLIGKQPFTVTVELGSTFQETLFAFLFGGEKILNHGIAVVNIFAFIILRR